MSVPESDACAPPSAKLAQVKTVSKHQQSKTRNGTGKVGEVDAEENDAPVEQVKKEPPPPKPPDAKSMQGKHAPLRAGIEVHDHVHDWYDTEKEELVLYMRPESEHSNASNADEELVNDDAEQEVTATKRKQVPVAPSQEGESTSQTP